VLVPDVGGCPRLAQKAIFNLDGISNAAPSDFDRNRDLQV
jgi:hypothetical protein